MISSCLVKPADAPCTALASRARSRPWRERSVPPSPGRWTSIVPSSLTSTGYPSKRACSTRPLGPSATKRPSAICTLVPLGTGIGILPTRDIASLLPDLAQQLAADPPLARLSVGEQPLRRRDDPDAEAVAHGLDLFRLAVDPAARLADPLEMGDGRDAVLGIAEEDAQRPHRHPFELPEILDEAFLAKQLHDFQLQLGGRHVQAVVLGDLRVADPGQQVRDRVGHAHCPVSSPTSSP